MAEPTGKCLSNANSLATSMYLENKPVLLVHGTVTSVRGTFRHAWVETPDKVIDPTQGITTPKSRYYKMLDVRNVVRIKPMYIGALVSMFGLKFYTEDELKRAVAKDKEFMARVASKKKGKGR